MQVTKFGLADVDGFAKVEKLDGRVLYYALKDGENFEITEEEYREGGGA